MRVTWMIAVAVIAPVGCRFDFDKIADDLPSRPDGPPPPDSLPPPLPAIPDGLICGARQIALGATPAPADLAIGGTIDGYAALWVDASAPAAAHGIQIGAAPDHAPTAPQTLDAITDTELGAISDAGDALALASTTGPVETTRVLGRDLTISTSVVHTGILAHGAFPATSDLGQRAFVTAQDASLEFSRVAPDGSISPTASIFDATGQITEIACADGPDHTHCTYVEALPGGASQCTSTDVRFFGTNPPQASGGHQVLSQDCHDVRASSGADAADSVMSVWTTTNGAVEARYVGAQNVDISQQIAPTGSAPKLQFDGARFWIAWLGGDNALHLDQFDPDGTLTPHPLPGWVPSGPEAFELVRGRAPSNANETLLAILRPGELDLLPLCPST